MATTLATLERPLRAAIIGAGPSGFYAAAGLLKEEGHTVTVDMFDRLVAPHGLVRYGVAPDHQNIKAVAKTYDRTAADPDFRYFGNVEFGKQITHEDLQQNLGFERMQAPQPVRKQLDLHQRPSRLLEVPVKPVDLQQ